MPSAVIKRFTYDNERRVLLVLFRSGRSYAFHDVAPEIAAAMRNAFSKGEFFNTEIRGRYRFTRVLAEPAASAPEPAD